MVCTQTFFTPQDKITCIRAPGQKNLLIGHVQAHTRTYGVWRGRGGVRTGELVESHVEEAQVGGVTQIAGDGPREAVAADVEGGQVRSQP